MKTVVPGVKRRFTITVEERSHDMLVSVEIATPHAETLRPLDRDRAKDFGQALKDACHAALEGRAMHPLPGPANGRTVAKMLTSDIPDLSTGFGIFRGISNAPR